MTGALKKCGQCGATLREAPAPRADGLPGILYNQCHGCGWSRAVTIRPRRVRLPAPAPPPRPAP